MSLPDFTLFDAIGEPVFVLCKDARGEIVYGFMNAAARDGLGMTLEDIVGKSARELFHGRTATSVYKRQREAWANGVEARYEIGFSDNDDQGIWARTHLTPQFNDAGEMTHMVGLSRNISHEKALEQAHAMTEAMRSEMQDFVSLAAHDLRSPIANVRMLADLLRDGFVDYGDGKLELISMIEEICERSLALVTDMLSGAVTPPEEVKPQTFSFRALCDDILVTLDPAEQHDVSISQATVEADYSAVQIVLRNLVDNALKHAGRPCIRLRLSVCALSDETLEIAVADNGKGFDDPAQAFSAETLSPSMARAGYGLVGVRRLVRARGGRIHAEAPQTGTGALIRVEMPGRIVSGQSVERVA